MGRKNSGIVTFAGEGSAWADQLVLGRVDRHSPRRKSSRAWLAVTILFGALALGHATVLAAVRPIAHRPPDFGFRIEDGDGNCIDSDSSRVTKDLVVGPDTTIALRFTDAEMDTIWGAMVGLDVFGLTEPHPDFGPPAGLVQTASNSTWHLFAIHGGGRHRRFWWADDERDPSHRSPEISRFWKAMRVIEGIVERRPEYRALPRARGLRL